MADGAQFVMTFGTSEMLMLCAGNWDFLVLGKQYHVQGLDQAVDNQLYLMMYDVWAMRAHFLTVQVDQLAVTIAAIMKTLVSDAINALQVKELHNIKLRQL